METLTKEHLSEKLYEVFLAEKKYLTYTRITLVLVYSIEDIPLYIVRKKFQDVFRSSDLQLAIDKYNSYSK